MQNKLTFPKPETVEDPEYLKWIRGLPCLVCLTVNNGTLQENHRGFGPVAPHHVVRHNDHKVIPLCFNHHRFMHDLPDDKFTDIFYLNKKHFSDQVAKYRQRYKESFKK